MMQKYGSIEPVQKNLRIQVFYSSHFIFRARCTKKQTLCKNFHLQKLSLHPLYAVLARIVQTFLIFFDIFPNFPNNVYCCLNANQSHGGRACPNQSSRGRETTQARCNALNFYLLETSIQFLKIQITCLDNFGYHFKIGLVIECLLKRFSKLHNFYTRSCFQVQSFCGQYVIAFQNGFEMVEIKFLMKKVLRIIGNPIAYLQ